MGSINRSHNEADGGILLFQGELILLYCDSVDCEVGGKESFKGRVYLTTHRLVVIIAPYRQNANVKSICAPFCAIAKCSVEQPIFGANYIEATVRDEADPSKSFSFKLKFSKGGAIELAMAMNRAVAAVGRSFNGAMPPAPAYTPSPSAQYYQAPPTVYAPGYNSGIQMPVQQFPDQPPIGFIYASEAPPPYPGLGGNATNQPQQQQQQQQQPGYGPGYPSQQNQPAAGLPTGQQQYPGAGYPGHGGYPPAQGGYNQAQFGASGYPASQQPPGAYPGHQQQPPSGYPQQQPPSGYPQQQPPSGYPQQQQQQPPAQQTGYPHHQTSYGIAPEAPQQAAGQSNVYPDLNEGRRHGYPGNQQNESPGQQQAGGSWPSAPSFNPNWQDDKKNV